MRKSSNYDPISILGEIGDIISYSHCPDNTLIQIAEFIATKFHTDVCSIYLFDEDRTNLVLSATIGLNETLQGQACLSPEEGITGLVVKEKRPIFTANPAEHPRYKYIQNSGEEKYQTYLGVPLIYHNEILGALVVQTISPDAINESKIPLFSAIGSQISSIAAYSGLKKGIQGKGNQKREEAQEFPDEYQVDSHQNLDPDSAANILRGMPVSSGFAIGKAHYDFSTLDFDAVHHETIKEENIPVDIQRINQAFESSYNSIKELTEHIDSNGAAEMDFFHTYLMILQDASFKKKIVSLIEKMHSAEYALKMVITEYLEIFNRMEDDYMRERGLDIEDLGRRILRNLLSVAEHNIDPFEEDTILVAEDISPLDVIKLSNGKLKGIVLCRGGKASHAVILAQSYEIPMIIGVNDLLEHVKEGDLLVLDASTGNVFNAPSPAVMEEFQKHLDEKQRYNEHLALIKDLPAETKDGYKVELGANIGIIADMDVVAKYGADHIGLYRTEFPFIIHGRLLPEDEQYEIYEKIVNKAAGMSVTIRTLDIGGDKFLPYLNHAREDNPYLGWRSIRMSLDMDSIFREQIRAILRVSMLGPVRILFPMISSVNELTRTIKIINEEQDNLRRMNIAFDEQIQLGIMVEIPGTVHILKWLVKYVDFVNIGTNDLIQYTLAVDRNNPKVAHLYNPLHPAVLHLVNEIVTICQTHSKEVNICGEAASDPKSAMLYLGMGADRLSLPPASIPRIKKFVRDIEITEARSIAAHALKIENEKQIALYMNSVITLATL